MPQNLCVSTLSILSEREGESSLLTFLTMAGEQFLVIYLYLASAMIASKSVPKVSSSKVFLNSSTI